MKIISSIVGAALLIAALILSFQTSKNGEEMKANKDVIMTKYIAESDKALSTGDVNVAIKFAKMAIQFDPNSKKGFDAYEKIMEVKYKPEVKEEIKPAVTVSNETTTMKVTNVVTSSVKNTSKTTEKAKKEVSVPAVAEEPTPVPATPKMKKAAEEPMGC